MFVLKLSGIQKIFKVILFVEIQLKKGYIAQKHKFVNK